MGILNTFSEIRMALAETFCLESNKSASARKKLIAEGHKAAGTVTGVKTCWWIKINTKPVRLHGLDGAKFPHIIYFTYSVNGAVYQGSTCAAYYLRCPNKNETITVFYDKSHPEKYAVSLTNGLEDG